MCRLTKNIALKICKLKFLNRNKDLFKKNPLNFIQTYFMFGFALTFVNILTHIFSKIHYLFFIFWTGEKTLPFCFSQADFLATQKGVLTHVSPRQHVGGAQKKKSAFSCLPVGSSTLFRRLFSAPVCSSTMGKRSRQRNRNQNQNSGRENAVRGPSVTEPVLFVFGPEPELVLQEGHQWCFPDGLHCRFRS